MKRFLHRLLCLSAVLLCGCVEPLEPGTGRSIALTVFCEEATQTKAEVDGVNNYNENLISWVDFFFFPGENPTGDAVLHTRVVSGDTKQASFQVKVSLSDVDALFPTAGNTRTATVLAVANSPRTLVTDENDLSGITLAYLNAQVFEADFTAPSDHRQPRFLMCGQQVLTLSASGREAELVSSGSIRLKRLASKLTVSVHVADLIERGNEKWHPMLAGMEVYLVDGVNKVKLSGRHETPGEDSYFSYSGNRMRFASRDPQTETLSFFFPTTTRNDSTYYNTYPMYMYPQAWEEGSANKAAGTCEPHLKVLLPWYCEQDDDNNIDFNQKQCYYKVMMPANFNQAFQPNYWYHLDLDVEILGALSGENAIPIQSGSCFIVPWQNPEKAIKHESSVGTARYLSVSRDTLLLQNVDKVSIPIVTSHPAIIKPGSIRVTRAYYGTNTSGKLGNGTIKKETATDDIYPKDSYYLDYDGSSFFNSKEDIQKTSTVVLDHPLNNDYTDKVFDYSPYTISFTLVHEDKKDGGGIECPVVVVQYPAVYIDRLTNSDANTVGGTTQISDRTSVFTLTSTYWGYTFADGAYVLRADSTGFDYYPGQRQARKSSGSDDPYNMLKLYADQKDYQWRAVWYTGGSPDLYQIHVTVLSDDDFTIGDPRLSAVNNLDYSYEAPAGSLLGSRSGFAEASSLHPEDDGQKERTLLYYHPTDPTTRTINMLAPSYRVSSKFSGTEYGNLTLEVARRRCAAFQEDGFPAGRWRLPTLGEVRFIAQLSANSIFTTLFNNGGVYWSANGAIRVNGSTVDPVTNSEAMLRCVYDTWYWGEDQSEYDAWRKTDPDWLALPEGDEVGQRNKELRNKFVWGDRPR